MSKKIDVDKLIEECRQQEKQPQRNTEVDALFETPCSTCGFVVGLGWMWVQLGDRILCTDCFCDEFPAPERLAPGKYQMVLPHLDWDQS